MKSHSYLIILTFLAVFAPGLVRAEVIIRLPTNEKVVALTFDACNTRPPSSLDRKILDFVVEKRLPCSIFSSGGFAARNRDELARAAGLGLIRIENHSLHHYQHMEKLPEEDVKKEILQNEKLILEITKRRPSFFRFPAGNCNERVVRIAESLGYRVVHWTFPSGDPIRETTPCDLARSVLSQVKEGSILIFHINGRGYHTGEALPQIVHFLEKRGYGFTSLEERL